MDPSSSRRLVHLSPQSCRRLQCPPGRRRAPDSCATFSSQPTSIAWQKQRSPQPFPDSNDRLARHPAAAVAQYAAREAERSGACVDRRADGRPDGEFRLMARMALPALHCHHSTQTLSIASGWHRPESKASLCWSHPVDLRPARCPALVTRAAGLKHSRRAVRHPAASGAQQTRSCAMWRLRENPRRGKKSRRPRAPPLDRAHRKQKTPRSLSGGSSTWIL